MRNKTESQIGLHRGLLADIVAFEEKSTGCWLAHISESTPLRYVCFDKGRNKYKRSAQLINNIFQEGVIARAGKLQQYYADYTRMLSFFNRKINAKMKQEHSRSDRVSMKQERSNRAGAKQAQSNRANTR